MSADRFASAAVNSLVASFAVLRFEPATTIAVWKTTKLIDLRNTCAN
jgi:hypothetical protein